MSYRGARVQVCDKNDNVLVDDIVLTCKNNKTAHGSVEESEFAISFDGTYFINLNSNAFIIKKISDNYEMNKKAETMGRVQIDKQISTQGNINNNSKIQFDIKKFSKYRIEKFHDKSNFPYADIYRENNMCELDPEIECLVKAINEIPNLCTSGSCSGHGEDPAWVTITFFDYDQILYLSNIIYYYFIDDFVLQTHKTCVNPSNGHKINMMLKSTKIGEEAYKKVRELSEIILKTIPNIYPRLKESIKKYNDLRVQIRDKDDNILVDDIVQDTFNHINREDLIINQLTKNFISVKCLISFDKVYYFNFNSILFSINVFDKTNNFERIKLDVNRLLDYRIVNMDVCITVDAPIYKKIINEK